MTAPDFAKMDGLVPAVAQDVRTGEVLTLAYQDEEAWERTLATGQVHYWSRSRQELWHKGATSGNVQDVDGVALDCDADAVLLMVDPQGPACHEGFRSCYHQGVEGALRPVLVELSDVIADRDRERPEGSYTTELLQDPDHAAAKVREEADELVEAAGDESGDRVAEEAADLLYHVLVLLRTRGVDLADALDVLRRRRR